MMEIYIYRDKQTQSLITKKLSGGHNGGLDQWWWWWWWWWSSSSSSSCVGAWFGNLVLVKMMMIDVRQLDERERERRVCVMLLLTHYFVQWCICFTSSLLQIIGIHGMHMPLCLFDGWLLVVKVHSPIISSSFFIKKKLLGRFQRLSISKEIGCQVYQTKIWVIFQITGWEPLVIYI